MTVCVILVGGRGKRLGKLTNKTPKPLLNIDDAPFLDHLIYYVSKFKISKIILLGQYKIDQIIKRYHNKKVFNIPIEVISEQKPKGTAGCLYDIKKKITKNFLVINGDSFLNIDLDEFIHTFDSKYAIGKMSLIQNQNYLSNKKLSSLNINNNKVIFENKRSKLMNAGVYLFSIKIFKYIMKKKVLSLEEDLLPKLIINKKISGKIFKNIFFIDIGLKKNYRIAKKKLPSLTKNKAVLLDRDGVLNQDKGYIYKIKDFKILVGVIKAIKLLNDKKYFAIVVTNQSGIGRGYYTEGDLNKLHDYFQKLLLKRSAKIDKFYYCPYHETGGLGKYKKKSFYRKPNPGMLFQAIRDFNLDKKKCFMIGDKLTDKQAANKAGIKFYYKKKGCFHNQIKKIV